MKSNWQGAQGECNLIVWGALIELEYVKNKIKLMSFNNYFFSIINLQNKTKSFEGVLDHPIINVVLQGFYLLCHSCAGRPQERLHHGGVLFWDHGFPTGLYQKILGYSFPDSLPKSFIGIQLFKLLAHKYLLGYFFVQIYLHFGTLEPKGYLLERKRELFPLFYPLSFSCEQKLSLDRHYIA